MSNFIRINGFTRKERNLIIGSLGEAIGAAGGWILDSKMYSNKSIAIIFELPLLSLKTFYDELNAIELKLTEESEKIFKELSSISLDVKNQSTLNLTGTLQITFIHNEPDLRIEIPAIPG